jgi:hypothetical protein
MSENRWLFLDCHYLGYRAYYSTGGLEHGSRPTGVLFGVLRDLRDWASRFGNPDVAFFFDHRKNPREVRVV